MLRDGVVEVDVVVGVDGTVDVRVDAAVKDQDDGAVVVRAVATTLPKNLIARTPEQVSLTGEGFGGLLSLLSVRAQCMDGNGGRLLARKDDGSRMALIYPGVGRGGQFIGGARATDGNNQSAINSVTKGIKFLN